MRRKMKWSPETGRGVSSLYFRRGIRGKLNVSLDPWNDLFVEVAESSVRPGPDERPHCVCIQRLENSEVHHGSLLVFEEEQVVRVTATVAGIRHTRRVVGLVQGRKQVFDFRVVRKGTRRRPP